MSMNFNRLSTDDKILIMEGAQVLGDVVAGEGTAFWYNSVCRGEMQSVRIGKRCNIQDLALIHNKVTIGDDVSVGHCATVHGATIGELDEDTVMMDALDAGAEDFSPDGPVFEITTDPDSFNDVVKALEDKGYTFLSADIAMVPQNYITLTDEGDLKNMQKLIDMLEDNDDVQNVWHNWENE